MKSTQWFLIGALVVALIALGYIYYQDQNTISIETGSLPQAVDVV